MSGLEQARRELIGFLQAQHPELLRNTLDYQDALDITNAIESMVREIIAADIRDEPTGS